MSMLPKAEPPEGRVFRGFLVGFTADQAVRPVLSSLVEPFADVVRDYARRDGDHKSDKIVHAPTSSLL